MRAFSLSLSVLLGVADCGICFIDVPLGAPSWSYVLMICFIRALVAAVFVGFASGIHALVAGGSLRFVCAICH